MGPTEGDRSAWRPGVIFRDPLQQKYTDQMVPLRPCCKAEKLGSAVENLDSIQVVSALFTSLANLAAQAGFPTSQISVAVAVALAESSGNPNAYNPETAAGNAPGQGSYGLWQINLAAHPEFESWNLFDPQANANAAYRVWQQAGGSFSPWTTFRTGTYQAFLPTPPTTASSPYAPWPSTLTILSPASLSSMEPLKTLAIAAAVIIGLGFVLEEI